MIFTQSLYILLASFSKESSISAPSFERQALRLQTGVLLRVQTTTWL